MNAALATRGLSLAVGGAQLVTDLTLDVAPGELLGVIGPNGAGKTTLFNLLTGILTPTSGQVLLGGRDVTRTAPPNTVVLNVFVKNTVRLARSSPCSM